MKTWLALGPLLLRFVRRDPDLVVPLFAVLLAQVRSEDIGVVQRRSEARSACSRSERLNNGSSRFATRELAHWIETFLRLLDAGESQLLKPVI